MKKLLSVLLAVMMLLSAMPVMAEEVAPHVCEGDIITDGTHTSCVAGLVKTVPATCTEDAYTVYECHDTDCVVGTFAIVDEGSATGHTAVVDENGDARTEIAEVATCTEEGSLKYIECATCHEAFYETIPAKGHDFGEATVVEPDCENGGYSEHTCKREGCGVTEKFAFTDKNGHKLIDEETQTKIQGSLCDANGYIITYGYCEVCQKLIELDKMSVEWPEMDHQKELVEMLTFAKDADIHAEAAKIGANEFVNVAPDGMQIPGATEGMLGWFHDAKVDYVPAKCGVPGHLTLTCTSEACGASHTIVLPAREHIYNVAPLSEEATPTCMTDGSILVTCDRVVAGVKCDFLEQINIVAKKEHNEDSYTYKYSQKTYNGVIEKTDDFSLISECVDYTKYTYCHGYEVVEITLSNGDPVPAFKVPCNVEGHIDEEVILGDYEKHNADPKSFAVKAPTCEEKGYKMSYCLGCGESIKVDIDATGHTPEREIVTEPTCTEKGASKDVCAVCGKTVAEYVVPATGHDFGVAVVVPSTCTTAGTETKTCLNCGHKEVEYLEFGHKKPEGYQNFDSYNAPTCTKPGSVSYTCEACHKEFINDPIPAKGHTYERNTYVGNVLCEENGIWYDSYEGATCKNVAVWTRSCDECTAVDTHKGTEKKDHMMCIYDEEKGAATKFNLIIDTKNLPTCEKEGYAYFNCAVCGEYQEIAIPAFEHHEEITWNAEKCEYEITCTKPAFDDAHWTELMGDYLWDVIEARTDMKSPACVEVAKTAHTEVLNNLKGKLAEKDAAYISGIGCGKLLDTIKVNKTEYVVTMEGNKVTATAKDNIVLLEDAYILVSWAYELSDGSSFTFSNLYTGKANDANTVWEFTVRAGKLQNATLKSITAVVTNDIDAENVLTAKSFGDLQAKF